jgi:hypothetical protein
MRAGTDVSVRCLTDRVPLPLYERSRATTRPSGAQRRATTGGSVSSPGRPYRRHVRERPVPQRILLRFTRRSH